MKLSHIVLALAAAALAFSANAKDVTGYSGDKLTKYVIHGATMSVETNEHGNTQVNTYISFMASNKVSRMRLGVTGCATTTGYVGELTDDGYVIKGSPKVWIADGPSVRDNIAELVCAMAGAPSASTQSSYTPGSKPGKFAL